MILSQYPLKTLDLVISKSKNAPLDIRFTEWRAIPPEEFWTRVLPHSHKCRSLQLAGGVWEQKKVVEAHYPILTDLKITDEHSWNFPAAHRCALDIPNNMIYNLRHLHLADGWFRWDLGALAGLRALTLEWLDNTNDAGCPSTSQLIAVLHASPGLVALHLGTLHLDDSSAVEAAPVHLDHLVELVLQYLPFPSLLSITTAIRIPNCSKITLIARDRPKDVVVTKVDTAHLYALIRSILERIGACCATLGSQNVELAGTTSWNSVGIHIVLPVTCFQNPLDWFDTILDPISPLSTLSLSLELSSAPHVTSMVPTTVRGDAIITSNLADNRDGAVLMNYLSRPAVRDGTERWAFRDLSHLELVVDGVDVQRIVDMVRLRAGGAEKLSKSFPRRLRTLHITHEEMIGEDDKKSLRDFLENDAELLCIHRPPISDSGSEHEGEEDEGLAYQNI
ncbi:hypothetical protein FRB95_003814 [Tulasnella sp. JGI-2019a]|nr:hypothetical protein FRB95_003814 [Tulasnella sp. JGI-2019a]